MFHASIRCTRLDGYHPLSMRSLIPGVYLYPHTVFPVAWDYKIYLGSTASSMEESKPCPLGKLSANQGGNGASWLGGGKKIRGLIWIN